MESSGTLVLCATPIGNLGDASPRLREALAGAAVGYAEDTRRSAKLLNALGVSLPLRSFFVGNEAVRVGELAERLRRGETVALLTDAGVPAISDPGFLAVRAALEQGARITIIPGPSAVTAALAVSGFPSERFVFDGYLPRSAGARSRRLQALATESRTIVLFASPFRLGRELEALTAALGGDRRVLVARELTKLHEELWRGSLAEASQHWQQTKPRGEFTLVIAPA